MSLTPEQRDKQNVTDMQALLTHPEFLRFLWRAIQSAGIYSRTTDGSEGRSLDYFEGRRNLGLDILDMAEAGQPAAHPDGTPVLTLMQTLREETQHTTPQETPSGRRNRSDRYSELDGDA